MHDSEGRSHLNCMAGGRKNGGEREVEEGEKKREEKRDKEKLGAEKQEGEGSLGDSVEYVSLDVEVVSSNPTLGAEMT